jgi:hypothetical protein
VLAIPLPPKAQLRTVFQPLDVIAEGKTPEAQSGAQYHGQPETEKSPQERGASEKRAKSPSHYPPQAFRIAFTKPSMSLRAASITGSCPAARKALLVTGPMLAA